MIEGRIELTMFHQIEELDYLWIRQSIDCMRAKLNLLELFRYNPNAVQILVVSSLFKSKPKELGKSWF